MFRGHKCGWRENHVRLNTSNRHVLTLPTLLKEAADATPDSDWVEGCAEERKRLRSQMQLVTPVKAKTLELLGLASFA